MSAQDFYVGRQYRTNPLSHTEGGTEVRVEMGNGMVLVYDRIKYPQAYIATIVNRHLNLSNAEAQALAESPDYVERIKKVVRRVYVGGELYWEQSNPHIPWLKPRSRTSAPRPNRAVVNIDAIFADL